MLELAQVAAEAYARSGQLQDAVGVITESERAMMIIDGDEGEIVHANDAAEGLFGVHLAGTDHARLIPERLRAKHAGERGDFMQHLTPRPMGASAELSALTRDRGEISVQIGLTPLPGTRLVIAEIDPLE